MTASPINQVATELRGLISARQFSAVPAFWNGRGRSLHGDQASCRLAAAALAELDRLEQAVALLSPWLQQGMGDAASYALVGRLLLDLGRMPEALAHLSHAVHAQPTHVQWWRLLAETALAERHPGVALAHITPHRLRFNDDHQLAFLLIRLFEQAGRVDEALLEFERALAKWPGHPQIGSAFAQFVTFEFPLVAVQLLDRVRWAPVDDALTPARVVAALAMPAFHATDEEQARWQRRIISELRSLTRLAVNSPLRGDERAQCLSTTMFFAPYTELDVTELMFAWGDFVEAIAAPLRADLNVPDAFLATARERPVRTVGFVTNRGPKSSAGRMFQSWIDAAVSMGFEVHVFALGAGDFDTDAPQATRLHFWRYPEEHPKHWRAVAQSILATECDVLIYPEPQGSSLQTLLAGIKLAPLQAAGFGNPVTTGLRTMDFFLTPDEAEPPDGEHFYRERLVRLSATWSALQPAPVGSNWTRAAFGGGADERWYVVTQPMMKWSPRFRAAVIDILRRDPLGRLVFVQWALAFSPRAFELMLREEFSRAGLNYAERVHVVGFLNTPDYSSLLSVADVMLDTFGFAGGVSTADAIALGQSVVTLRGKFLRGRQSASLLECSGAAMDVVESYDGFVSRCVDRATSNGATLRDPKNRQPKKSAFELEAGKSTSVPFGEWLASL